MELPFDALAHIRADGEAILELARATDPTIPIECCPGWAFADLVAHVGGVWHFWVEIADGRLTERSDVAKIVRPTFPSDVDQAMALAADRLDAVVTALSEAPTTDEIWTFAGVQPLSWLHRRLAHENSVHRWDAEHAVGRVHRLDPVVAADGIDEYLHVALRPVEVPRSVHLHCTDDLGDVNGEWLVRPIDGGGHTILREHAKGDAAVRGSAHDLQLWLWGRSEEVEILGDAEAAHAIRSAR